MSSAFNQLLDDMIRVSRLLDLERDYTGDRPSKALQPISDALRGGALVLMVASFEFFLRELFEEYLTPLALSTPVVAYSSLPPNIQLANFFGNVSYFSKAPIHNRIEKDILNIPTLKSRCGALSAGTLVLDVFTETWSNPGPSTIKSMFKNVGIKSLFSRIHSSFSREWRTSISSTFISDTLQNIINRRNDVAHTGRALQITRRELKRYVRFFKVLGRILDVELHQQIDSILP